jgi:hypothetical protein
LFPSGNAMNPTTWYRSVSSVWQCPLYIIPPTP